MAERLTPLVFLLRTRRHARLKCEWSLDVCSTDLSLHLATGLVTSLTVTVALQVELLPLGSVAVRVTRLLPTLLQSKLVLLAERLTPQASVLPPSISAATMVA